MKRNVFLLMSLALTLSGWSQTLNVVTDMVTYRFPASQTGDMIYSNGETLTIMSKKFALADITRMYVDNTSVVDNTVGVVYYGNSAEIIVAGNVAQYITPTYSGAHVKIEQSDNLASEITYTLSGASDDGEFYMSGSYKASVELAGLTLSNSNFVYSGAAVHIQNGKRINIKIAEGTSNTLADDVDGSQKGCLYVKGHAEFKQKGTLNVYGNKKHAIKTGEYMTVKNATLNVLSAAGDGINCSQYFLMESGEITINGTADDGIQCDIDDTDTGSTGETANHEDEDSGNIYVAGGTVNINTSADAAKGIKGEGDINISGGTVVVYTSGNGVWDDDDDDSSNWETKAAAGLSCDGNMNISGGTITITSTGSGGKGAKCDGVMTISGGTTTVSTSGGLYYNNGTTENLNYTGETDKIDSRYYSSPKGLKAGLKDESGSTTKYSGGLIISDGVVNVTTTGYNGEGIESKNTLNISGGIVTVNSYDDAINSAQDMYLSGGYVFVRATNNDGIDANGNLYVQGGLVYAIGASSPEVALDANTENQKKLYVQGGTLIAISDIESGASMTQACYKLKNSSSSQSPGQFGPGQSGPGSSSSSSSYVANTWYALYNGGVLEVVFETPSSGGSSIVVSTSSTPTLTKGVTVSGGTEYFNGMVVVDGTVSGGESVELEIYSSNSSGGPNGR
ncbi:MAG: carbohydrate-binding domain-containing protein [Bacteroidales bacterium]|nr:carbohydrate-binding domain-containing protein [Bacteroidales bacterium]